MKRILFLTISILLFFASADAQKRVIDAVDHSPVAAASIFDATGNMVGFTWSDGVFSEVPESAYPITIRCMGYEMLVIEQPEDKTWEMTPMAYELDEVVIVPVNRNVLNRSFTCANIPACITKPIPSLTSVSTWPTALSRLRKMPNSVGICHCACSQSVITPIISCSVQTASMSIRKESFRPRQDY